MKNNLKQILENKGITQKQLSNMTGIPEYAISRYVSGDTLGQKYLILISIAKALNVEISDIIRED